MVEPGNGSESVWGESGEKVGVVGREELRLEKQPGLRLCREL